MVHSLLLTDDTMSDDSKLSSIITTIVNCSANEVILLHIYSNGSSLPAITSLTATIQFSPATTIAIVHKAYKVFKSLISHCNYAYVPEPLDYQSDSDTSLYGNEFIRITSTISTSELQELVKTKTC